MRTRARVPDLDWLGPAGFISVEVGLGDKAAALLHQLEEGLCERALVDAARALVGEELDGADEPRLLQPVARAEELPARRIDPLALVHRHHGGEHREARGVGLRERGSLAGQAQRGLDEALPGNGPWSRWSASRPAMTPGTPQDAIPTA